VSGRFRVAIPASSMTGFGRSATVATAMPAVDRTIETKSAAVAPRSWASEESQIESREHQDNANVRYQPFPESVSEERDIQTNYDGYHCHDVNCDSDLFVHFSSYGLYCK